MKKKLRILYISTEISPFNAESPLSELSFHFTRYCRAQGHDIRVVMPRYSFIRDRKYNLREVIRLREIPVILGGRLQLVAVKSGFIPDTKVQVYFLEHEKYLSRDGVTVDPETGKLYADSDERFIVFSRAVVEMLKILSWQPQIIHAPDWTAALTAYYLNAVYGGESFYSDSKMILSLSDYENCGNFPRKSVFKAGIDPDTFQPGIDIELGGEFNYLKAGALYANKIIINGDSSIQEFSEPFRTWFKEYIKSRGSDVLRIPFGIDIKVWSPDKDEKLTAGYSYKDTSAKVENKKMLLEKYSLQAPPESALIGCVWDGGDYTFLQELVKFVEAENLSLVIADKSAAEDRLTKFAETSPGRIGAVKLLTSLTLKQLVSGSDFMVLSPGKYKDLLHFKAARYGSLPLVPCCGFFADDIGEDDEKLPGFFFDRNKPESLVKSLVEALRIYKDEKAWSKLQKKAMKFDSGWNKVARSYLDIYNELT